jgi:lipopolysaccharide export system protein LptA
LGWLVLLAAGPSAAQSPGAIRVLDARAAEYDATTGTWLLWGDPVRVLRKDLEIAAAQILYRERERVVIAEGRVRVRQRGQTASADKARAEIEQETVLLTGNVALEFETPDGIAVLRAATADVDLRARRAVARGEVHAAWERVELRSESATADLAEGIITVLGAPVATMEGVRLEAQRMRADLEARVLQATDGVRIADARIAATAHGLEARWVERVATLRGDVVARRGYDVLRAEAVRYDFASGRLIAKGRPRVVVHP